MLEVENGPLELSSRAVKNEIRQSLIPLRAIDRLTSATGHMQNHRFVDSPKQLGQRLQRSLLM